MATTINKKVRQSFPRLGVRRCRIPWILVLIFVLPSHFSADAAQKTAKVEVVDPPAEITTESWSHPPLPERILETARRAQLELEAQGLLDSTRSNSPPTFIWPVRQLDDHSHHGYWTRVSFVDHDSRYPGYLLDYNGGERTYDLPSGYNHRGSDTLNWPFGWVKQALNQVEVVAAAPGRISLKVDGNFDRECTTGFGVEEREPNIIAVTHDDGSQAFYEHLKKGSLTAKGLGDFVEQGEYLGSVGSSGFSSYPHLHFEVYGPSQNLIDPFAGPHNSMNGASWWADQPSYWDSEILAVMTHSAFPRLTYCYYRERTHVAHRFRPGDPVYLALYFREFQRGKKVELTVLDPDGKTFERWRFRPAPRSFIRSYQIYRLVLPDGAPWGRWTFRAKFKKTVLEKEFEVGHFEPSSRVRSVTPTRLQPGITTRVKIRGFGFDRKLVADIQSPTQLEKQIEILAVKARKKRVVLTVQVDSQATPGRRDIVLTAPDYSQVVIEDALRISEPEMVVR